MLERTCEAYSQAMPSTEVADSAREPITSLASPKNEAELQVVGSKLVVGPERHGHLQGRLADWPLGSAPSR